MATTNNVLLPETTTSSERKSSSPRKVLGQLSTNIQLTPKTNVASQKQTMSAMPLKRSFKTAIGDAGFNYLKRRRFSTSSFADIAPTTEPQTTNESTSFIFRESRMPALQRPDEDDIPLALSNESDRESSSERHSFSSLINYDPSSQTGPSSQTRINVVASEEAPSAMSRAELLRMRLQVAMYKVRTKQTTIPFDYLREDTLAGSKESSKAVQEAVEQLRQEARAKINQKPTIALTPTLSSPTLPNHSPERTATDPAYVLAVTPNFRTTSPIKRLQAADLTSSAVKGQVAQGLLGLKHGF
ncbi:hypothetical protein AMS68_001108 [Peltaster fructicola]|uniref:Uncharacterized protein n=1 Tax=Peltaster fructicola TaxID=286661 RepID=A0A6H0XLS6_9PEZI|nr:hypothetical protein AMS68_001108 [Peltaster fructicola]